jgi:hypothetical protein
MANIAVVDAQLKNLNNTKEVVAKSKWWQRKKK